MRLLRYILLFLFISLTSANSQKQAFNWYFGAGAGLTFSPSGTTANFLTDGALNSAEGCASISDMSGNLLFYSDGSTVWDKNHSPMSNGTGLNGSGNGTQSCIIIPKPLNNNIYYIFTINPATYTLSYSEIDISQNSGLGAVVSKNNSLLSSVAYKITAVHQQNGYDYWVLVHGYGNNNFYCFSVSSSGVSSNPVTSSIGSSHAGGNQFARGQMKLSPDGSYAALAVAGSKAIELFEFDDGTGSLQRNWLISYQNKSPYGIEFSPDCSKFYVTFGDELIQCTINAIKNGDTDSMMVSIGFGADRFYALQLGPDRKIYVAQNNSPYLGRISNPNFFGSASGYSSNSVQLSSRNSLQGLPSFVQSWMTGLVVASIATVCEGETVQLSATMSRSNSSAFFSWTGPSGFTSNEQNPIIKNIRKNQEGYYKITVTVGSMQFRDSTYIKVESLAKARIIPDGSTTLCEGDSLILFAQPVGTQYSYYWSTGSGSNSIIVRNSGRYYLTVSTNGCRSMDSIDISVVPAFIPEIKTTGPKVICEGDTMQLEARPSTGNEKYIWSTGDTTQKINIRRGGTYTVTIDILGCQRSALINILNLAKPATRIIALGPTSFCDGDSTLLVASPIDPEYSLLWSTGETNDTIVVKKTGEITLEVNSRNGCSSFDTIDITSGSELQVDISALPNDKFCEGDTVTISANPYSAFFKYKWSTGETGNSILITKSGNYWVTVESDGGCSGSDTLAAIFSKSPVAALTQGSSQTLCAGDSLQLFPKDFDPGSRYEWSTGQNTAGITVKNSGQYRLIVTNPNGCSDTAQFELFIRPSPLVSISAIYGSTLCIGDSALLIAKPDKAGYDIAWSNGAKGDSIVVFKSGIYKVTATNSELCSRTDSIEVQFNPYPELELMPGPDLTLCSGDTVKIFAKSQYYKYQWNDGDSASFKIVTKPGTYTLTVFDSTGCRSTASAIVRGVENSINGIEDFEFGNIPLWFRTLQNLRFWNAGRDSIVIDSIYTLRNPDVFGVLGPSKNIRLATSDDWELDVYFYPKDPGIYEDSLVIAISSPCPEVLYFSVRGVGKGGTGVGLPDTSGLIGTKNFRIPLTANIKLLNQDIINLSYTARIRFLADVFLPSLLTNGIIRHDTIINGERIISIQDENVVITKSNTILTEITGTILLGKNKITPIIIEDFRWDNPLIDASLQNGSLEALALCFDSWNLIQVNRQMTMSVSPNPVNDNLIMKTEYSIPGDYTILIHSSKGKLLGTTKFTISEDTNGKDGSITINTQGITSGVYTVTLKGRVIMLRQMFIKN